MFEVLRFEDQGFGFEGVRSMVEDEKVESGKFRVEG